MFPPYLTVDHPRPPRPHLAPIRPRRTLIPGSAPHAADPFAAGWPRTTPGAPPPTILSVPRVAARPMASSEARLPRTFIARTSNSHFASEFPHRRLTLRGSILAGVRGYRRTASWKSTTNTGNIKNRGLKKLLAHGSYFSRYCCSLERQVSCNLHNPSQMTEIGWDRIS